MLVERPLPAALGLGAVVAVRKGLVFPHCKAVVVGPEAEWPPYNAERSPGRRRVVDQASGSGQATTAFVNTRSVVAAEAQVLAEYLAREDARGTLAAAGDGPSGTRPVGS